MNRLSLILAALFLAACTAVQVTPLDRSYDVTHICIEDNPKVIVGGFIGVVEDAFQDHGITTEIYAGPMPSNCEYKLTYTATRDWDFSPYLSHAELRLFENSKRIAYAEYHLKGGGGLSLTKWASVESKMKPVVYELLNQYQHQ